MTRLTFCLAVAWAIVTSLSPAWGQRTSPTPTTPSIPIDPVYIQLWGQPVAILTGGEVGMDPDGTVRRTVLHLLDTWAAPGSAFVIASLDPVTGEASGLAVTYASQGDDVPAAANWPTPIEGFILGGINTDSAVRFIFLGTTPTTPSHSINIVLWMPQSPLGGNALAARVEHVKDGQILFTKGITDQRLLSPSNRRNFSITFETGKGLGTLFTLHNVAESSATFTAAAYAGDIGSPPDQRRFAQVQISLGPGGTLDHVSIDDLFRSDPNFAQFVAGSYCSIGDVHTSPMGTIPQGVVTITSDQPLLVDVELTNFALDTPWFAFPSTAPLPPRTRITPRLPPKERRPSQPQL